MYLLEKIANLLFLTMVLLALQWLEEIKTIQVIG